MTVATYASTEWMEQAACRGIVGFTELDWLDQVGTCNTCPVRRECLVYGLDDPAARAGYGTIYGGLVGRQMVAAASAAYRDRGPRVVHCRCGKRFETTSARAKYCSRACRVAAWTARQPR